MSTTRSPSPPTRRVVDLLLMLGRDPETSHSATDICRTIGVAPATGHAILSTLTDTGFVVRDAATRTYRLGPALLALGEAAHRAFPIGATLRPDLLALVEALGLSATAATRSGDTIVIVEQAGGGVVETGQRLPCAPPFGAVHVAWSDDETIDRWLARAPGGDAPRREYLALLADIRELGYAVGPLDDAVQRLRDLLGELNRDTLSDELRAEATHLLATLRLHDYTAADLAGPDPLDVSVISAPVFDPAGRPLAVISVHVLRRGVPTASIRRLAAALLATTARMTTTLEAVAG